jgi:protein SCO1/2
MKFKIVILLIGCLITGFGSIPIRAQDPNDTVEVGVVEHLDNIIPDGLSFRDENNKPVILKDMIKHPTILALIYFDCPGICPQLLAGIANVVKRIDMQLGKDYQIITVSFNPLDTPDKALDKKNSFLDQKSRPNGQWWNYLTGDSANIYKLTNATGFKFIPAGNDFIHPSCITILSPQGKITRYLYGTSFLPFDVKMALIEAQRGISRPTINRILDFCFAYDPAGRRYSLAITKVTGTIIIFIALLFFITMLVSSSRKKTKSKQTSNPSKKQ